MRIAAVGVIMILAGIAAGSYLIFGGGPAAAQGPPLPIDEASHFAEWRTQDNGGEIIRRVGLAIGTRECRYETLDSNRIVIDNRPCAPHEVDFLAFDEKWQAIRDLADQKVDTGVVLSEILEARGLAPLTAEELIRWNNAAQIKGLNR